MASHQGRVGNNEYTGMDKHAKILEKLMGKKIKYIDVIGEAVQNAIKNLDDGDILLLDNLRLCAEENYEFSPENAAKTIMVKRLAHLFDLFIQQMFQYFDMFIHTRIIIISHSSLMRCNYELCSI